MAVWLVRDCGLFTYQGTTNVEAGYFATQTTEPLIIYIACCMLVFIVQSQSVSSFYKSNLLSYQSAQTYQRSTNRNEVELTEGNLFCFLWAGKP